MPAGGGSVQTSRVAANAITQSGQAVGVTNAPTTTSTSYVDLTDMSVSLTTVGGDLLVNFAGVFSHSSAGGTILVALSLDGAAEVGLVFTSCPANDYNFVMATTWRFTGVAAGSHTVKVRWYVGSGTGTAQQTQRRMNVVELKR